MSRAVVALLALVPALLWAEATPHEDYPSDVKPIIENRCMVCHGCYDAPCQLKLDDWIGLERGAHKNKVYDGTRLLPANLTRLYEDAMTTEEWRGKGFYPVLERDDVTQSVLYKMLALKQKYPLPTEGPLPANFDFRLDRNQSCPRPSQFGLYNQARPYQGMPYGFPGVDPDNMEVLANWLHSGAPGEAIPARPAREQKSIDDWEAFFNQPTNKARLMSRYIYEHLFIGNLYFDELTNSGWYKLVRSRTPPGQPIDIIATRRPYNNPGEAPFYYRLQQRYTSILNKRHMPYALNPARMARWEELFLAPKYEVSQLPGYRGRDAANPFVSFQQLPVDARYRFMLDEAHFTIMAYIKGPVCRGQVALNVIDDHFWVAFTKPNNLDPEQQADFLAQEARHMRLPQPKGSLVVTLLQWRGYARDQKRYLDAEARQIAKVIDDTGIKLDMNLIWDGGPERNRNAALTIFRHHDSASVVKGHVGQYPKSMWVIDYSLLERIHYLLVAGFDVYGNVGHQLESRLYMDFLRMEGEQNFLLLLPQEERRKLRNHWYRGASDHVRNFVLPRDNERYERDTSISYRSDNHKHELMDMFRARIPAATNPRYALDDGALAALMDGPDVAYSYLPEVAFLQVLADDGSARAYSLVHNRGHSNIAQMFDEENRLLPEEDTLTVAPGFIGSYPNMFFQVTEAQLEPFVAALQAVNSNGDYTKLVERFGVRRTAPWFWRVSDAFVAEYRRNHPVEAGLFDLNRYQNR